MNKRDLKLDEYGISKHRYRELYNFCLQYPEFIKEKQDCYSLGSALLNGMPKGSGVSNPTANSAERAYRLGKNIELIEQTAIEACGELYPYIIKAVTEGWTYNTIFPLPPCRKSKSSPASTASSIGKITGAENSITQDQLKPHSRIQTDKRQARIPSFILYRQCLSRSLFPCFIRMTGGVTKGTFRKISMSSARNTRKRLNAKTLPCVHISRDYAENPSASPSL